MIEIEERAATRLRLTFKRSGRSRVLHWFCGGIILAMAVGAATWSLRAELKEGYDSVLLFAIIVLGVSALLLAVFYLSQSLETWVFDFDKAKDQFIIRGRNPIFKRQTLEGPVSGIKDVSWEEKDSGDDTISIIRLTYRDLLSVAETAEIGTGEASDDEEITNLIKTFLIKDKES
jgi:hypothetical protein